jgi:hypothetical protein
VENVTDIVERLHWDAAAQRSGSETEKLEREAADEIDRLREQLATCRELRETDKALIAKLRAPLNIHHRGNDT